MVESTIKVGDVVHDLVERGKMQVVDEKGTVADVRETDEFDLAEYKAHPLLDVHDDDRVYTCVYLPDSPTTSFSGTYDFPESRLARVPVEEANQDLQHPNRKLFVDVLASILGAAPDHDRSVRVAEYARNAGVPEPIVEEAVELLEAEQAAQGGND